MIASLRHPFSPVEHEIALGIGEGLSYREIGTALGISRHTVRFHVRMMADKVDADTRAVIAPRELIFLVVKQREWEARMRCG